MPHKQYESTLRVSQAAYKQPQAASYRPLSDPAPCYRTRRPSTRADPLLALHRLHVSDCTGHAAAPRYTVLALIRHSYAIPH